MAVKAVSHMHEYDKVHVASNGGHEVKKVLRSRLTYLVGFF